MGFTSSVYGWASRRVSPRQLAEDAYNRGFRLVPIKSRGDEEFRRDEKQRRREMKRFERKLKKMTEPAKKAETPKERAKRKRERARLNEYARIVSGLRIRHLNTPGCLDFEREYTEKYIPFRKRYANVPTPWKTVEDFRNDVVGTVELDQLSV